MGEKSEGFGSAGATKNDLMSSRLQLFAPLKMDNSIEGVQVIKCRPLHLIKDGSDDSAPIEFQIVPLAGQYLALHETQMYLQLRVWKKQTNAPMVKDDACAMLNVPFHSLWSSLETSIGDRVQPQLGQTDIVYKSYFESCFSYGTDAKHTVTPLIGFRRTDSPGYFSQTKMYYDPTVIMEEFYDDAGVKQTRNKVRKTNQQHSESSTMLDGGSFAFKGTPCADLFQIERYFPPGAFFPPRKLYLRVAFLLFAVSLFQA